MTFFCLINWAVLQLNVPLGGAAKAEVFFLIEGTFNMTRSMVLSSLQESVPEGECLALFQSGVHRRLGGEPLALILGKASFLGYEFMIKPGVLIPRPETELLVSEVLSFCKKRHYSAPFVLELGYGSGCILLSLALKLRSLTGVGWDISFDAYEVASDNKDQLSCDNVTLHHGNFFEDDRVVSFLDQSNVIFVANPPYIPTPDIATLDASVRQFEPLVALDGGSDGLSFYRQCFSLFKGSNIPQFYEIGSGQQERLGALAEQCGYGDISITNDYHNIPRILTLIGV